MKLIVSTKHGELAGTTDCNSIEYWLDNAANDFAGLQEPSICHVLQQPNIDKLGQVQLKNGAWCSQNDERVQDARNLMITNVVRMTPMRIKETYVRVTEIVQIREMTSEESSTFNDEIQAAKLKSDGLVTNVAGLEMPDAPKNVIDINSAK